MAAFDWMPFAVVLSLLLNALGIFLAVLLSMYIIDRWIRPKWKHNREGKP